MARFCINFHMSPADYYALTVEEHQALTVEWNKSQSRR